MAVTASHHDEDATDPNRASRVRPLAAVSAVSGFVEPGNSISRQQDVELLDRIAAGDLEALGVLYDRHCSVLYGLALRILTKQAEAEAIICDVCSSVWNKTDVYDDTWGSPASWLIRLTRLRAVHRLRQRRPLDGTRRGLTSTPLDRESSEPRRCTRISRALLSLPRLQRDLIECAFFRGLTSSELADEFGLPIAAVRAAFYEGLRALRDALASSDS